MAKERPADGRYRDSIVRADLIDPKAFWEEGWLQEVNRRFLHPVGLSLSLSDGLTREHVEKLLEDSGYETGVREEVDACMALLDVLGLTKLHFFGVHDGRDDPEGVIFGSGAPLSDADSLLKRTRVQAQEAERRPIREAALGYWIQPIGGID